MTLDATGLNNYIATINSPNRAVDELVVTGREFSSTCSRSAYVPSARLPALRPAPRYDRTGIGSKRFFDIFTHLLAGVEFVRPSRSII